MNDEKSEISNLEAALGRIKRLETVLTRLILNSNTVIENGKKTRLSPEMRTFIDSGLQYAVHRAQEELDNKITMNEIRTKAESLAKELLDRGYSLPEFSVGIGEDPDPVLVVYIHKAIKLGDVPKEWKGVVVQVHYVGKIKPLKGD